MPDDFDEWIRARLDRDPRELIEELRSMGGALSFEPEPDAPHEPWRDPQASGRAVDRRYCEFVRDKSAKFYAVVLATGPTGWSVSFNFGRIGSPRAWALKVSDVSEDAARQTFDALNSQKAREGYEPRRWPADLWLPGTDSDFEEETATGTDPIAATYRATKRGMLPPASGGRIGDVDLPSGRLVAPHTEYFGAHDPVMWVSDYLNEGGELWGRLVRAFDETGLWPLMVDDEADLARLPELISGAKVSGGGDPATILESWWTQILEDGEAFDPEVFTPLGQTFPGVAGPTPGRRTTDLDRLMHGETGRVALVSAQRPADVLASIGWEGAANYDLDQADQSTVLRSWEDRFDAYVVGFGSATLVLAVGRPPQDKLSATRIAAEHFAFCPDMIWQGVGSTMREYIDNLVRRPNWVFWWD